MSTRLRLAVRKRAQDRCEYCRLPDLTPHLIRFHLEHIRARRHGGRTSLRNLAWACPRCNERKGTNLSGVDPDTNRVVRVFNPRRDVWKRHFAWDGLRIRGLTATGRARPPGSWNSMPRSDSSCGKVCECWACSERAARRVNQAAASKPRPHARHEHLRVRVTPPVTVSP
jgi:hypothetical protein